MYSFINQRGKNVFIFAAFAFSILPLLYISNTLVFNVDEYSLTFDVLNKLNGLPIECSAWPGGTVQFLSYPFVMFDILIKTISNGPSLDSFSQNYANAYFNINKYVFIIRCVNTLIFDVIIGFSFITIWYKLQTNFQRISVLLLFVLLICNSSVSILNWTATSDSMAFSFSLLSSIILLFSSNKHKTFIAGIALGLAIANKITFLVNAPLFMVILFFEKQSFKQTLTFILGFCIAYIFVCPFLWTDTFRILKSVAGNLSKGNSPAGFIIAFEYFTSLVGVSLIISLLISTLLAKNIKDIVLIASTFLLICFNLFISSRSGSLYPRYFLPVLVPIFITVIYQCINTKFEPRKMKIFHWLSLVIVLLQSGYEISRSIKIIGIKKQERIELDQLKNQINSLNGKTVLVPFEQLYEFSSISSKETFSTMIKNLESNPNTYEFFKQRKLSVPVYKTFKYGLLDQEFTLAHRLRIFESYTKGNAKITIYSPTQVQNQRYGLPNLNDSTKYDYLLVGYSLRKVKS